ncbi:MAG: hypothetical protein RL217_2099 [Pseudomonadota bacterium]|jgi:MATE family multidrug resistance protein
MSFSAQEIRSLTRLTLPILATQLAQVGMGTVDTLMSGHISTEDLAAVAIGTSLWMPVWLFVSGVLVALSPLASALNAGQRHSELPKLLAAGMYTGIGLGILAALVLLGGSFILESQIADEKTAFIAANYTRAIAVGMPFAGLFLAYRLYAEALNQPFHVTRIMLTGLVMNIPANGLFIYGWFGMPELGGIGCGIGSSLVFIGMTLALALNTHKHRIPKGYPIWQEVRRPRPNHVRDIIKIGIPIGVAIFFEVSLFVVIALFLARLGPVVVAGHQVALNLASLTFMIPLSIGMALTVRVSFWRGKGETLLAKKTAWLGIRINLVLALINACFMVIFASHIAALYSPDPQVIALASALLLYAALFQLSDAVQVAAAGALRAYHDTFAVMLITFVAYWFVGLGGGYYLAYLAPTPMGAQGFWIGLILGLTVAAILLGLRLRKVSLRALA